VLAIVAPGQGAQTPGFVSPWLELPGFRDRLSWLSLCAGMDLVHLGTEASAEEITDTAVAQPLLVASGLVSLLSLFPHPSDAYGKVAAGAGHSVGEITAATAAGVITAEQAMILVRERGRAMASAAAARPTGMTAVLGGDADEVIAALDSHGLTPANINAPGQVVAAGTLEQLDALAAAPPDGARLRPLRVAGAFHTEHMRPAVDVLSSLARAITTHDPRLRLLSNRDGAVVHHGHDALSRLVDQVANPVRWDLCMRTMADLGITALIELPPAGTLTALAKRALPGIETVALKTPDDIPAALDLVARHATASPISEAPSWRMLVAPSKGVFRYADGIGGLGAEVEPGSPVGTVEGLRDATPVLAPHGGTIIEWLVEEGDPVSPGQPVVRLHPVEVPA
jgi:[acyl-carrier-protein] S-malonyltransferase